MTAWNRILRGQTSLLDNAGWLRGSDGIRQKERRPISHSLPDLYQLGSPDDARVNPGMVG